MNHLLRPRIWPSFLASSGVGPFDVPVKVRLETNTLRLPGGTPIFVVSRQQFMTYSGYHWLFMIWHFAFIIVHL